MGKANESKLYFIAFIPPSPLLEEIARIKEYVSQKFGCKHALKSPPHITIHKPFRRVVDEESQMCGDLDSFFNARHRFPIQLNGFDAFEPRVVFIDIKVTQTLVECYDDLQRYAFEKLRTLKNVDPRPYRPHMTLAFRDLSKDVFQRIWEEFRRQNFEADFETNSAFLLRHTGRIWEINREFHMSSTS